MRQLPFTLLMALAFAAQAQMNDARKDLLYPVNPPRKVSPDARPGQENQITSLLQPSPTPAQIPTGGEFKIEKVDVLDKPDGFKTAIISISFHAKPAPDPDKVKVLVCFHEKTAKGELRLTEQRLDPRWTSPPIDWKQAGPEVLSLKYELPATNSEVTHHGCRVEVFYNDILQDNWRSSPDIP